MKIHERLKEARNMKKYTQAEVAEILHVSRTTISSWETGRTVPALDLLVKLSDLYDISLDNLLKDDDIVVKETKKIAQKKNLYKLATTVLAVVVVFYFGPGVLKAIYEIGIDVGRAISDLVH